MDDDLKRELQRRLYELLSPLYSHPSYFPGGQPVSFTRDHLFTNLLSSDYFVCEKSDGCRYLLYLAQPPGGLAAFLIDRNWRVSVFPGFGICNRSLDLGDLHADTLIDGELIEHTNNESKTFLMFDCLLVNGEPVYKRDLPDRLAKLKNHVVHPFEYMIDNIQGYAEACPFRLKMKEQYKAYGIRELLERVIPEQEHPNDGLIFTPVHEPYRAGTWNTLLKWKPSAWNTVDFLIGDDGVELFIGDKGRLRPYSRLQREQLQDSAALAAICKPGSIIECRLQDNMWTPLRPRPDKTTPNDVHVVEKILQSIKDDVTERDLISSLDDVWRAWKARERGLKYVRLEWRSFKDYPDYVGYASDEEEDVDVIVEQGTDTTKGNIQTPEENARAYKKMRQEDAEDSIDNLQYDL